MALHSPTACSTLLNYPASRKCQRSCLRSRRPAHRGTAYNSSEVELNVSAWYFVCFSILYYMDIKHEMDSSVSVLARLLPGRPENRGSIYNRAALFFVILKTSSVTHPAPYPNGTRGSLSGNKVLEALKLRMHGALPPPRRVLRMPIASRIILHLTWYLCITFTHPPAQKTLEYSNLKSEPAGSSETPQIT